jgi:hypothetical protein
VPADRSPWVDHITGLWTVAQVVSFEEPAAPLWGAKAKPRALHVDVYTLIGRESALHFNDRRSALVDVDLAGD